MPNWVNASVFYHIYPLGFCGAPEYNDGQVVHRLDKLADWIPHLKKLRVNALYIGPLFEASRHGYDTKDYYKVDQRLGDNTSFKALCSKLHANGIRVVLDGVFNHVGREFWAFKDVQEKEKPPLIAAGSKTCILTPAALRATRSGMRDGTGITTL